MLFSRNKQKKTDAVAELIKADTNFHNADRQACMKKLDSVLSAEQKHKGAVLKIYLENFKLINDSFGFDYGELLLNEIVGYLGGISGSLVYRYMGVEFIIVLEDWSYSSTMELTQQISERFFDTWTINDIDCICSVCGGVAFYPGHAANAPGLIKILDYAIAEAGVAGLNHFIVYDEELKQKILRKRTIGGALKDAVKKGNIKLRYRPTYHVLKKQFTRAECYLQLFVPELGLLHANEFLPVAEDSGQICAIDYYAIEQTCGFIRSLLEQNKEFESVAVRVSPVMLLQDDFVETVTEFIRSYSIPRGKLGLELNENILVSAFPNVGIAMQALSDAGVELVLNDFGTGFSAINNVLSLPVDVLKLERLFVWQLETNPRSGVVIQGLIQIAHNLGLKLIAEGVETENQIRLLEEYHCVYEQGFYYSPTVDGAELAKMLPDARVKAAPAEAFAK